MPLLRGLISFVCSCLLCFLGVSLSHAAPDAISLKNIAEVEIQDAGKTHRITAKYVPPNGVVIYTSSFKNTGEVAVRNIVITNPIPQNTLYIADSAIGNNADISYSLDGKHFDAPAKLEVKGAHGAGRPAIASDYTYIRWVYKGELQPGQSGETVFRVKVR